MGIKNYLIDGGSGTGKTTVCTELQRRGYQAIHGDRELKITPTINKNTTGPIPGYDIPPLWDLSKVNALIDDQSAAVTFFCGGCSNSSEFMDRLDGVFVLEVKDLNTILQRVAERVRIDPTDWGAKPEEREIIIRAHETKQSIQNGWVIGATAPLKTVVDEILRRVNS